MKNSTTWYVCALPSPWYDSLNIFVFKCSCDNDVADYKRILGRWFNERRLEYDLQDGSEPDDSEWPPCSRRYLAMAYTKNAATKEPPGWVYRALQSGTESDVQETTLWLNDLLHDICREVCGIVSAQGIYDLIPLYP